MPFPKLNPLIVGDFAYVRDPEDQATQYRVKVLEIKDGLMSVALFPNPDVEPLWGSLDPIYIIPLDLPVSEASRIPFPGAAVRGYQSTLINAKQPSPGWTAADGQVFNEQGAVVQTLAPAAVSTPPPVLGMAADLPAAAPAQPPTTPQQALALQQKRVLADQARAAPPAQTIPTASVAVGMQVVVKAQEHSFWGPLAGQIMTVRDVSPGEPQWVLTVEDTAGNSYENVAVGRFDAATVPQQSSAAAPSTGKPAQEQPYQTELIGQLVTLKVNWSDSVYNGILEACGPEGVAMMSGQVKATWDQVVSLARLDYSSIPGAPPPNRAKATKDSPAPAGAEASAPQPAQTSILPERQAAGSAGEAFNRVVAAVETILGGKKVSRAMVEGLRPLLKELEPWVGAPAKPVQTGQQTLVSAVDGVSTDALRGRIRDVHALLGERLSEAVDALHSLKELSEG